MKGASSSGLRSLRSFRRVKVKGEASKPLQLKGLKPSFSSRSLPLLRSPVLFLKPSGFEGGFEALKGDFATFVWFHFLLSLFLRLTSKSVLVWLSPFFVWENVDF